MASWVLCKIWTLVRNNSSGHANGCQSFSVHLMRSRVLTRHSARSRAANKRNSVGYITWKLRNTKLTSMIYVWYPLFRIWMWNSLQTPLIMIIKEHMWSATEFSIAISNASTSAIYATHDTVDRGISNIPTFAETVYPIHMTPAIISPFEFR